MATSPDLAQFRANQLTLKRGSRVIWENATWSLQGPCAILGANGSGKSSTLALLAGQVSPDDGQLTFQVGQNTIAPESWMTSVSLSAPWMDFPKYLTLKEIVNFHGIFKLERPGHLGWNALLESSGLDVGIDVTLGQWSSGQRQRLALALAFGTQTHALLLDEPTSNLDNDGILWFQNILEEISLQTTTIVVTNDVAKEAPKAASLLEI